MALGATIKVKMDTSAVRRGMASIRGMFSRLGGALRGLGGMMRKSLLPVVGILAGFGVAAKRVADLGSELSDMSVQTGVSVERLVELKEALRLAGVPMRDTSRALSLMASSIQEARFNPGLAREAIQDILGLNINALSGMGMDEQFMTILERIRDVGDEIPQLERAMEGIFGARMGFGILRLAKDLDANMEQAGKNVGSTAKFFDEYAGALDKTADSLGRLSMIFQEVIGRIMIKLPLDKIADAINSIKVETIVDVLMSVLGVLANPKAAIQEAMAFWSSQAMKMWSFMMASLTATINGAWDSISEKIKKLIPTLDPPPWMPVPKDNFRATPDNGLPDRLDYGGQGPTTRLINETNRILGKIERKEGAMFA